MNAGERKTMIKFADMEKTAFFMTEEERVI